MKKISLLLIVLMCGFYLNAQTTVNIPDVTLRNAICAQLGISTANDVYDTDMLNLTTLTVSNVNNLTGLHYASNLQYLNLFNYYNLQYLSEISNLTGLQYLNLGKLSGGSNSATALSNIQNLVNLQYLNIENFGNNINFSYLSGLTNLSVLKASGVTSPTNLSGITTMTALDSLDFSNCGISDISAIYSLTNLKYLNLYNNNLNDGQLHHLYAMDLLLPILDLRNNGTGFSNDSINKLCNELASIDSVQGNILYQVSQKTMQLSTDLRVRCAQIDTISMDVYRLSGDVTILKNTTGGTYHDFITIEGTPLVVNKFINSSKPRISGNGIIKAFGEKITEGSFLFIAKPGCLVPQESYPTDYMIDGFLPSGGSLFLENSGTSDLSVRSEFSLFNLKYPFDKVGIFFF